MGARGGGGERTRRAGERCLGISLVLCVVFLWVFSSFLIQSIFSDDSFPHPFFLTYTSTSLFSIYLIVHIVWEGWLRSRRKGSSEREEGGIHDRENCRGGTDNYNHFYNNTSNDHDGNMSGEEYRSLLNFPASSSSELPVPSSATSPPPAVLSSSSSSYLEEDGDETRNGGIMRKEKRGIGERGSNNNINININNNKSYLA